MSNVLYSFVFRNLFKVPIHEPFRVAVNTLYIHSSLRMAKPGFYAVKVGRVPGVYKTWAECEAQVRGFPKAMYKKFSDIDSAQKFIGYNSQKITDPCKGTSSSNIISKPSTSMNCFNVQQTSFEPQPSTSFQTQSYTKPQTSATLQPQLSTSNEPDGSTSFEEYLMDEFFRDFVNEHSKPTKSVYYAVHRGIKPGVYMTWTECEAQIKTTKNASYRKFDNEREALEYVQTGGIVKATKRELQEITYSNSVVKKCKTWNQEPGYILLNPDEPVVVFTDGASAQNGRKKAHAGIGVYWGPNHPLNASKRLPGRQTNNRAEIQAAVYALNQAKQIGARKVKLYTDSQFLIHSITDWIHKWKKNGWKLVNGETVVNKDDFLELEVVSQGLEVDWTYVRAHARNHGNDEADRLAVAGARLLLEPSNCSEFPKPEFTSEKIEPFILTNTSSSVEEILPLIIPEETVERRVFYAVHRGKNPGVYKTWTDCEKQTKDFVKPWFKKFSIEEEAVEFVKTGKVVKKVQIPEHGPDQFITVFTDGASSCNGQDEAKAGIGVYWGPGNELNTSAKLPGRQTNNRAEIHAAVYALRQARQLGIKNVRLYTDSQFVIKGITEWIEKWKQNDWMSSNGKPVINKEDFIVLDEARQGLNVDWCHVKGHDNNPGNVEADKLAVAGCTKKLSKTLILA